MSSSEQFVSVVMPVRNAGPHLEASIRSILTQSHREFEFVIRDDGSTDGSTEELRRWARRDGRIRLFEGETSLGPAESSNWVVRKAEAPLVARMDADDISHPDRLRRQVAVLARQPAVVLVGSLFDSIDAHTNRLRAPDLWRLARPSPSAPFAHGSVMFRRQAFELVNGYRSACDYWEDLDLFLRLAAVGRVVVLADALYRYRFWAASSRGTSRPETLDRAADLATECVEALRQGRSYEPLLDDRATRPPQAKLAPRAFMTAGVLRLWSGRSPGTLGPVLRRGALRWDRTSAYVLAWSLVGALSPRFLRLCHRAFAGLRNYRARRRIVAGAVYDWSGGRQEPGRR